MSAALPGTARSVVVDQDLEHRLRRGRQKVLACFVGRLFPEQAKESFLQQIPLRRIGSPEDVAEAAYWLCSDAASYITGQTIHVNGGMFM